MCNSPFLQDKSAETIGDRDPPYLVFATFSANYCVAFNRGDASIDLFFISSPSSSLV